MKALASIRALTLAAVLLPGPLLAEDKTYVMVYRGENEWVAQDDAKPLRQLLKDTRALKANAFTVSRNPGDNDARGMNRVLILRDILRKRVAGPLTLTETMVDQVASGTIVVTIARPHPTAAQKNPAP